MGGTVKVDEIKEINFNETGDIIDTLSGISLKDTPEERVRQRFIGILQTDYGYPKANIAREVPVQQGSKILLSTDEAEIRADIVVYANKKACLERDQGNILFVVECKKPTVTEGYTQLVSYIYNTSAIGGVWTNGEGMYVYKKRNGGEIGLDEILTLPRYREGWSGGDSIPSKSSLPRPHNVRFLLSACHNKLYGRGMENEDFDLAMDMVRILLAKIQDETAPGDFPRFWITERDFQTAEGRKHAATEIQKLFREYANQFPDVFDPYEKIQVGDDCIAEAVGVLKNWSLAARNDDADDWDLMGETYLFSVGTVVAKGLRGNRIPAKAGQHDFMEVMCDGSVRGRVLLMGEPNAECINVTMIIFFMDVVFPKIYSMIFGEQFYKLFVHAHKYEKFTVVKQFVPIYDMSASDSKEIREQYAQYLPDHKKKYGNNIMIIGGRFPRNDYLIIDQQLFNNEKIKYNAENLYKELFRSMYANLGYIDAPAMVKD